MFFYNSLNLHPPEKPSIFVLKISNHRGFFFTFCRCRYREKSKQLAEQNAAVACLLVLGVHDGRKEGTDEEAKVLAKKWQQILSDEEALTKDLEVNPLPTNSTDDDKLQVNGEIRQEIDSFSTKLDTSKSTKNLTESEHENKEKVIQKTFASEDSCTRQTAVNR